MKAAVYADLKLMCSGATIGALVCSAIVPGAGSSTCGSIAMISILFGLAFRQAERRFS